MKLTTKKIIAREFLILMLVLALGLISFFCTYPYNAFERHQVEKKSTEILEKSKLADSLSFSFKSKLDKQEWFYKQFTNNISDYYKSYKEFWERLDYLALKDSIKFKWEKVWEKDIVSFNKEMGFPNPEALHAFIENNRINKIDSSNYDSSLAINSEVDLLSKSKKDNERKILSYNDQTAFGIKALIICFIILFGLRYLLYSIKWSLKTLKQKGE